MVHSHYGTQRLWYIVWYAVNNIFLLYSVTIWLLGVLDFCMLIIILLINWLLNFIDGKLVWISITEFRKALTNDSHSQTMKLYLAKMVHIYYQDIYLIQRVGSRQLASRGSSDQMGHKAWSLIRWSAPGNMTPLQIMLLLWR